MPDPVSQALVQGIGRISKGLVEFAGKYRTASPGKNMRHAVEDIVRRDGANTGVFSEHASEKSSNFGWFKEIKEYDHYNDPGTNWEIQKRLQEKFPSSRIEGFSAPGIDTRTAKEIESNLIEFRGKYPHSDVHSLHIDDHDEGVLATTDQMVRRMTDGAGRRIPVGSRVTFSKQFAQNRPRLLETIRKCVDEKFHPHLSDVQNNATGSILWHEFGHVLSNDGKLTALAKADRALFDHFVQTRGHTGSSLETLEQYFQSQGGDELARTWKPFGEWRSQLSRYSFWNGRLDPDEALAEAFSNVEMSGARATEPAQVLHKLLVDEAEAQWRKMGKI